MDNRTVNDMILFFQEQERLGKFFKILCISGIYPLLLLHHGCPEHQNGILCFVINRLRRPHAPCAFHTYGMCPRPLPVHQILRRPYQYIPASGILRRLPPFTCFNTQIRGNQIVSPVSVPATPGRTNQKRVSGPFFSNLTAQDRLPTIQILPMQSVPAQRKINLFSILLLPDKMCK